VADPIKLLRQLKEQDAKRIGEEELDGVKTQVYRLHRTDIFMSMTLSKDETAKLRATEQGISSNPRIGGWARAPRTWSI
jgi:hypothetical protein